MSDSQRDLAYLEGVMLETYRRELGLEINDPDRVRAVYGSSFFDAERVDQLQGICQTAVFMLEVEAAAINVITEDKQINIASVGSMIGKVNMTDSYCQHVVGTREPFAVGESISHALVCESISTTDGGIHSYLGVPLINREGFILGSLCAWNSEPHTWTDSHVAMLTSLAAVVMRIEAA